MYNIVPVTVFGTEYNRLEISPITVAPNESASWFSKVHASDGDPAKAISMDHSLAGADYDAWGSDDQYVIDRTAQERGVVLAA